MNQRPLAVLFILILFSVTTYSQNNMCGSSLPFCTDTVYNFPAGVNAGTAEAGPDYTCLGTQPNPAWYYMEIANPGPLSINMTSTPQVDIDFTLWGPFTNQNTPCTALLTAGNTVDCSYSTSWNETADIPNGQVGEIYILLICNYSNNVCNINFLQSGGTGSTNCGILAPPIVNNGPLCEGETLEITVTNPVPNAIYTWTGPNGFTSSQMNITIPNVTMAQAGDYSLVITVNGQTSPANVTTFVVNPWPIVTLASFQTVCTDEPDFPLTGGLPVGGSYTGAGVTAVGDFSPATVGAGMIPIMYTYETPEGCRDSAAAFLTVEDRPVVTISPNVTVCEGFSTTLDVSGGVNYVWSNFQTTTSITVTPTATTTYTVTVSSTTGCSETSEVVVAVNPNPTVTVKPDNPSMCAGEGIDLVAGGGETFLWSSTPGDASLSGQNNSQIIFVFPVTTTTYTVTATDAYGCINTSSQVVSIHPNPEAYFYTKPTTASILEPYIYFFDNSYNATSYLWTIGDGTTETSPEFSHVFSDTGHFNVDLIVSNQWGCKDSTSGLVYIKPNFTIYIPNTFTPNKDLKNDVFYVYGEGILEMEFHIYDRWGGEVFYTDDINMGWDGKLNGENCTVGVYFYKLIYKDGFNKKNYLWGTVTLLR